jgi:uncharacterized protein involved in exopolysaccharide biosynthesis
MTPNEMSLERLFFILRAWAKFIVSIFTAGVIIAGIITYLTPKMYTATNTLNFDFSGNPVESHEKVALFQSSYISTQIGIIESLRVAQRVENSLTEYERRRLIAARLANRSLISDFKKAIKNSILSPLNSKSGDQNPGDEGADSNSIGVSSAYSGLARGIGSDLSVQPMYNSRIVEVSYSSTDPKIAALMANKYAGAYIAANIEMIIHPAKKSEVWFDAQLKSLRKRLEEAQSRLTEYQQKEGIVSSDERLDTETARLQNLSNQLVTAQQTTRNAVTEKKKLEDVLAGGASLMTFEPVAKNPVVQRIKTELRVLEGQRVQSSSSLGKNHPKIKKLNSEMYAAQERLAKEVQSISDAINNASELSKERELDLEHEVEKQKRLVLDLKSQHDKIAVLEREVESLQATYNASLNQLNTTSMQSMVEQTNVSIVDAANIPRSYSSPSLIKNLMLGAVGGLLLGVGVAVFREILVRRVYSREDLTAGLGVPLLGHLKKV